MEPHARHSTSPEDCSDGNDAVSAPSEFLAEFLSAIMRRQYLEALKYCRLILQYEPHNATARGFYPLLQHKVHQQNHNEGCSEASPADSLSDSSSSGAASRRPRARRRRPRSESPPSALGGAGWSGAWASSGADSGSGSGSGASQWSLELDSSSGDRPAAPAAPAAPAPQAAPAPPAPRRDDNGNQTAHDTHVTADDLENDNDVAASATFHESSSSGAAALRRLRAHFACSIK